MRSDEAGPSGYDDTHFTCFKLRELATAASRRRETLVPSGVEAPMPSWGLLFFASVSVLGTLAVMPLGPDVRALESLGLAAVAVYVSLGREAPRFRAALFLALVAAAGNAEFHQRNQQDLTEHRTARYAATLLERENEGDGSSSLTLALDNGAVVQARVRDEVPPAGARLIVRGRLGPFDEARNPGEPSEREMERERGLDGRLDSAAIVCIRGASWNARIALSRVRLKRRAGARWPWRSM